MAIHLILLLLCYRNSYIFNTQSPLSSLFTSPPGQTITGQIVLFGDLCLNANSEGIFRNSWAIPVPRGFFSAQASGLIQDSYYWNGSLHPVFQKRKPLQTPVPQSSPPHGASRQAGKLIKTIAAGTECMSKYLSPHQACLRKELVWSKSQYNPFPKIYLGKGKHCEWESGS